jgi:hypothetical protein
MSVKRDDSAKVNSVNRRGAFIALAKQLDIDPCELVVKTVKEQDSIQGAATKLGMNPNTIRYWLGRAGKEVKHRRKLVLVDTGA